MVLNKTKQIKKNGRLKGLEKKHCKAQKSSFTVALQIIGSVIPQISKKKNLSAPEICGITKIDPIRRFLYCNFLKNFKKTSKSCDL